MPDITELQRHSPNGRHAAFNPQAPESEPSYYDVSMLKPPVWGNLIAAYFFLGGLSAGAYLLSRMAERFGGRRYRAVTRAGTAVAAIAAIPCAPLLIADLGDPKRFHHMLRVFKPHSPMNLGAWTLTAYSGAAMTAVVREWLRSDSKDSNRGLAGKLVDGVLVLVTDVAGVPLALLLAGYTGVLLSATSTPVWSKNPWIGPLFSAGALSNGAAAIRLVLSLVENDETVGKPLDQFHSLAHLAEAATLAGFAASAGKLSEPLTRGRESKYLVGGILAALGAEALKHLPVSGRWRRWSHIGSSLLGLASGFAIRSAMVHAGPPSANDPSAARKASSPARQLQPSSHDRAPARN